ncbi:MAG: DNA polymerase III subunit delta [Ilumatobacteraceae bacterium]
MSVVLFHSSDETLLSDAVAERVRELVGPEDRTLMVEDYAIDHSMAAAVGSAETPSMFTERRVIILREVGKRTADDLEILAQYLASPNDETDLIIEWGSGRVLKLIADGLKACGGQSVDPAPPSKNKDRQAWWKTTIETSNTKFHPAAERLLIEWIGEDVSRFSGIADTLRATYGDKVVSVDDLRPFLGERGDSKPWDLTDAIEAGDAALALTVLRRLMQAGERHPFQILSQLHNHYARMARLDGVEVATAADAEEILGLKGFPAQKAVTAYRGLGSTGIRRAYGLLATADRDLRGGTGLEEGLVMDVLVARLARLTKGVSRRR